MADTFTPNFGLVLPEIGGSPDTWGNKLNENFSEIDSALAANAAAGVPIGVITMWSGAVSAIPNGWALCDGSNGTPDLRDRFVVGAGGEYGVGDTGGAANITLTTAQIPAHNHSVTVNSGGSHNHSASTGSAGSHSHSGTASSAGEHTHSIQAKAITANTTTGSSNESVLRNSATHGSVVTIGGASAASAGAHTHSLSINSVGAHTHSVTVADGGAHSHSASSADAGGGEAHENRPPYYALAYIMKL